MFAPEPEGYECESGSHTLCVDTLHVKLLHALVMLLEKASLNVPPFKPHGFEEIRNILGRSWAERLEEWTEQPPSTTRGSAEPRCGDR